MGDLASQVSTRWVVASQNTSLRSRASSRSRDPRVHPSSYGVLCSHEGCGESIQLRSTLELRRVVLRTSPQILPFELRGILIRGRRGRARPMSQPGPIPDVLKHLPACETYEVSEGLFFVFALGNPHFSPHSPSA